MYVLLAKLQGAVAHLVFPTFELFWYGVTVWEAGGQAMRNQQRFYGDLFCVCAYRCLKIKVDQKLTGSSGAKKAVFGRLSVQFQSFGQDICSE